MTRSAVVLMSGGIDSATCMALACNGYDEIHPIHFDYGQQTAGLELSMAQQQRDHLAEEYPGTTVNELHVIHYGNVFKHFAEGVAESEKDFGQMIESDGRSSGYVPMRNLHFIATAAGIADTLDAGAIFIGAQGGDEADYPDCRPDFMAKAAGAIGKSIPEGQTINLSTPLINKSKSNVIRTGDAYGVAFEYTYSCYSSVEDVESPQPCGNCPACIERVEAFAVANIDDPYHTEIEA